MAAFFLTICFGFELFLTSTAPLHAQKLPKTNIKPSALPVAFVKTQNSEDTVFTLSAKDQTVYFSKKGIAFRLIDKANKQSWITHLTFMNPSKDFTLSGENQLQTALNYFKGNKTQWKKDLPSYASITYKNLWQNIDVTFRIDEGQLKYTFTLKPGADANTIRFAYSGIKSLSLDQNGQLEIATPKNTIYDKAPNAYEVSGQTIAVNYHLETDKNEVSFELGQYDHSKTIVIDPLVFFSGGFIGGTGTDFNSNLAVDQKGNSYMLGTTDTDDPNFPLAVGPDSSYNGGSDIFIAKVRADATGFDYVGYIGGSGDDQGYGIAVDSSGSAYITGYTNSTEATFPVKGGPHLTYNGGANDAFIVKISPDGSQIEYAGYIGGDGDDEGSAVKVDANGNVFIAGLTNSTEATFPVKVGPDLTYNGGADDAFIAKISPDGSQIEYAGYIGGDGNDWGIGLALDSNGQPCISGQTDSSEATFPVKVGPNLTYSGGANDGFIAKVSANGTALDFAGYVGGSGEETIGNVAFDSQNNIIFAGITNSTEATFPVKVGPDLTYNGGKNDAFVGKITADGSAIDSLGYVGGSGDDQAYGLALDKNNNIYIGGLTSSSEATFPVKNGPSLIFNGGAQDGFLAKIQSDGTAVASATYIGGDGVDSVFGLALDNLGNIYISGDTDSTESSFPVKVGPDLTFNGNYDNYLVKIVDDQNADISLAVDSPSNPADPTKPLDYTFTISNNPLSPATATNVNFSDTITGSFQDLSAVPSQGNCDIVNNSVSCLLGDIKPGSKLTIQVHLTSNIADQDITHQATLKADQNDPNPQDNTLNFTTSIAKPQLSFDQSSQTVDESQGTLQISLHLSAASLQDISAQLTQVGGTASSNDYSLLSADITIPAGQTTVSVPLTINDDNIFEPDETAIFTLSNLVNALPAAPSQFTLTIKDNDPQPSKPKTGGSGACFSCLDDLYSKKSLPTSSKLTTPVTKIANFKPSSNNILNSQNIQIEDTSRVCRQRPLTPVEEAEKILRQFLNFLKNKN